MLVGPCVYAQFCRLNWFFMFLHDNFTLLFSPNMTQNSPIFAQRSPFFAPFYPSRGIVLKNEGIIQVTRGEERGCTLKTVYECFSN